MSDGRRSPIVKHISEGVGLTTAEPYVRHVGVLLSPFLQEEMGDFAIGHTEVPPHQQGVMHGHAEGAEVWLVYEGRGRALVGDEEIFVEPGTVVLTPPGVSHQFFNEHDEPVKLFFVFSPSGEEKAVIDSVFQ